ncbi:MAG TPA: hypothetical protein VK489_16600 [Ferruginibacter sp.]|nr:hypothetical protein [Ferruginibacter sp.]
MKNYFLLIISLFLFSCKKSTPASEPVPVYQPVSNPAYVQFTISAGGHYCDKNALTPVSISEMNFKVRFDSSAIYQTTDPQNQYDINKLYGFSEGHDHHQNSARIGWSWNDTALRLYAYTYKNGLRDSKEITMVSIGADINCGIKVSGNAYIFKAGNTTVTMPRAFNDPLANGYKLYPYFGGDEVAPADIRILIQELP